jgi:MFS transporter, DHA1 family, multidrug resistance protein
MLIISVAAFLVAISFLPETYPPTLLDWKAKQLCRATGGTRYVSAHAESVSFLKRMRQVIMLPAKFFGTEPVIAIFGGYLILLYILLFSFLSGIDYIFKQTYSLSTNSTGTCFAANYSSISIWSGLGACFVFGAVLIAIYVCSYEYIIDSYGKHSAIALASITMVRYLIVGGIVMAARPMYEGIGVHWIMTLLGSIVALLGPAPFFFWRCGAQLREVMVSEHLKSSPKGALKW